MSHFLRYKHVKKNAPTSRVHWTYMYCQNCMQSTLKLENTKKINSYLPNWILKSLKRPLVQLAEDAMNKSLLQWPENNLNRLTHGTIACILFKIVVIKCATSLLVNEPPGFIQVALSVATHMALNHASQASSSEY